MSTDQTRPFDPTNPYSDEVSLGSLSELTPTPVEVPDSAAAAQDDVAAPVDAAASIRTGELSDATIDSQGSGPALTRKSATPSGIMEVVEALLKSPVDLFRQSGVTIPLLVVFLSCHLVYGLICGSFSGDAQWVAAPLKVVAGTMLAGILCLPSLYIFACLSGADIRIADACQLLLGALALTSLLLLGFAPVAFIFTFSVQSITFMGIIHLSIWMLSVGFGVRYVLRGVGADQRDGGGIMVAWAAVLVLTML
jgi:hypothetical protein